MYAATTVTLTCAYHATTDIGVGSPIMYARDVTEQEKYKRYEQAL